jgi:hypothetical protein
VGGMVFWLGRIVSGPCSTGGGRGVGGWVCGGGRGKPAIEGCVMLRRRGCSAAAGSHRWRGRGRSVSLSGTGRRVMQALLLLGLSGWALFMLSPCLTPVHISRSLVTHPSGVTTHSLTHPPSHPPPPPPPPNSIKALFANKPVLIVVNKTDVRRLEDLGPEEAGLVAGMEAEARRLSGAGGCGGGRRGVGGRGRGGRGEGGRGGGWPGCLKGIVGVGWRQRRCGSAGQVGAVGDSETGGFVWAGGCTADYLVCTCRAPGCGSVSA